MATRRGRTLRKAAELMQKIATRKGYFDKNPGGGKDARKYLPPWSVDAKLTPSKKRKKHNIGGRAGYDSGGAILKGKKPLEKAMDAKKALQTKNVKKLTTSDDAYSPERRMIKIEKRTPSGGTGMVKHTTDWSNLKDETSKAKKYFTKKVGRPTSVQVLGPKDFPKARRKYNIGGRANLLEEMGRIDARRHPDAADRAEKRRVIGELNRGYKSGGAVLKGKKVGCQIK